MLSAGTPSTYPPTPHGCGTIFQPRLWSRYGGRYSLGPSRTRILYLPEKYLPYPSPPLTYSSSDRSLFLSLSLPSSFGRVSSLFSLSSEPLRGPRGCARAPQEELGAVGRVNERSWRGWRSLSHAGVWFRSCF